VENQAGKVVNRAVSHANTMVLWPRFWDQVVTGTINDEDLAATDHV
jgi:hypothetical protein